MFSGDTILKVSSRQSPLGHLSLQEAHIFIYSVFLFLAMETPEIEQEGGCEERLPCGLCCLWGEDTGAHHAQQACLPVQDIVSKLGQATLASSGLPEAPLLMGSLGTR